jgi:hypothetical protein
VESSLYVLPNHDLVLTLTGNHFLVRHLGAFPGINPQGTWLPDGDEYQANLSTPRASNGARSTAQDQRQPALEARMDAMERRLDLMSLRQGRHTSGEFSGLMGHQNDAAAPSEAATTPQLRPRASSVATSVTSILPSDPEDWLPGRSLTPVPSQSRHDTPTQSPRLPRDRVRHS